MTALKMVFPVNRTIISSKIFFLYININNKTYKIKLYKFYIIFFLKKFINKTNGIIFSDQIFF